MKLNKQAHERQGTAFDNLLSVDEYSCKISKYCDSIAPFLFVYIFLKPGMAYEAVIWD